MIVRDFHPYDLASLKIQYMQAAFGESMTLQQGMGLKEGGECFTALVNDEPIACIGLIDHWHHRRYVWAYLSDKAAKHNLSLTRAIHKWLRYHGAGRIETAINPNFPASIRWAERFGFEREGVMRHWSPDGSDWYLYARIGK